MLRSTRIALSALAVWGYYLSPSSVGAVAEIPQVVVTGSSIPGAVSESTNSLTIITRSAIDAHRPTSMVEVLRLVPGLHVDQRGGRGGIGSVYLRGADPNFVVVMIDGISVNDPTNSRGGSFNLAALDVANIERIEILRGSASAVYGSDAMAGVINIITRSGTPEWQAHLNVNAGETGTATGNASVSGPLSEVGEYSLWLSKSNDGSGVPGSAFEGTSLGGTVVVAPSGDSVVKIALRHSTESAQSLPDDSGGDQLSVIRLTERREARESTLGLWVDKDLTTELSANFSLSYFKRDEDIRSPGVAPGLRDPFGIPANNSLNDYSRLQARAKSTVAISPTWSVSAGLDLRRESGGSDSTVFFGGFPLAGRFSLRRATYGAFAETRFQPAPELTFQVGLRADRPEDFKFVLSPHISAAYKLNNTGTRFKLGYGEGFKLPSFFALGNPIVGNPNLAPEESDTASFEIDQSLWAGRASLNVAVFRSRFKNIVDFDAGPPPALVNRSAVISQGGELSFSLRPNKSVTLSAHTSYVKTDITNSTDKLRDRPKWRGGTRVMWTPRNDFLLSASWLSVGEVFDSSIPTGDVNLASYNKLDMTATWSMNSMAKFSLSVDNLLNEDYEEQVGFSAAGRLTRAGVDIQF